MNNINFLSKPSFPLSSDTLDFLQNIVKELNNITALGGNNYILSGCEVTGTSVSGGFVVVNGELLPFKAGTLSDTFIIDETAKSITALDELYEDIYIERVARFGSGVPQYNWSDLKRVSNLIAIEQELGNHLIDKENPHNVTVEQIGLGNVNNTSDKDKPISDAVKRELDKKLDIKYPQVIYMASEYVGNIGMKVDNRPLSTNVELLETAGAYDTLVKIKFSETLPTSNYIVSGSLRSVDSAWNANNDQFWNIHEKTSTYIKVTFRKLAGHSNLHFDFTLTAKIQ